MNKIDSLTKEQEARLPEIASEWIKYGLSTETNRKKAESLVPDIYKNGGLEPPKQIIWEESPYAGYNKCKELLDDKERPLPCYGSHDAHWLAFYSAFLEFGIDECKKLVPLMEMAKVSGWFYPMDECCILTPNPVHLSRDDRGRLHDEHQMAISYPDGWGLYYIHGVAVTQKIVENPETVTVEDIENEQNAEVRRIMVDRYGWEKDKPNGGEHGVAKYIADCGAQVIDESKWGVLYRKELPGDEPIVTVKVINSTPEPDGHNKVYWLRVHPEVKTAHEAVAWTFNVEQKDYVPVVET